MKKILVMGLAMGIITLIQLGSGAWFSLVHASLVVENQEEVKAEAPLSAPQFLGADESFFQNSPEWDQRFVDQPHPKSPPTQQKFLLRKGSGFSLKSPGKLPGIEFGVEMHSFQAFQSVVPSERMPKTFNFQQDHPLLQSPSQISPDYNGGFFRFTW
jgi:hypothetical protein